MAHTGGFVTVKDLFVNNQCISLDYLGDKLNQDGLTIFQYKQVKNPAFTIQTESASRK